MKISEAIRKGTALIPDQRRGGAFIEFEDGVATGACAIGAAVVGYLGHVPEHDEYYGVGSGGIRESVIVDALECSQVEMPDLQGKIRTAELTAIWLFEREGFTNLQVADYLEAHGA